MWVYLVLVILLLVALWPVPLPPFLLQVIHEPIFQILYLLLLSKIGEYNYIISLALALLFILAVHARETLPYSEQVEEEEN